ncbi:MAG: hypothetical protein JSS04_00610 [Proteobacteria bacterium]|nr:hypothetical protein [Pseudomonadota bacterium]
MTGLHRGENPQPGPAVAASLRRRFPDLRIIGLSYDPLESGQYAAGLDRIDSAYLVPYPHVGHQELLTRLDAIARKDPFDIVIPCLDSEIENYHRLQRDLAKRGIACVLPDAKAMQRRSKENLARLCEDIGVPTPATRASSNLDELLGFAASLGYPAYVKGRFYEARLVHSPLDLRIAFDELMTAWGGPVLVQEVVVGEEYDVVGLGDGKGGLLGSCSIRKMLRTKAGKAFGGVVVADPALDKLVHKVIRALKWNGPFELEFAKSPRRPHRLFEMNPRFPAWVDFPSQLGCNLPACMVERMLDLKPAPLAECAVGQMFVRHCVDIVGNIADLAQMASMGERSAPRSIQSNSR